MNDLLVNIVIVFQILYRRIPMASSFTRIYDVPMEHFAYSLTGHIGTSCLSPCLGVIVTFIDNTVMLEHRSDIDLWNNRTRETNAEVEAMNLLEEIADNVRKCKKNGNDVR